MDKMTCKEHKLNNTIKIKSNYYRTIGSKVECRHAKRMDSADQTKVSFNSRADRSRSNKTAQQAVENHKAVALTFYNLFNDAKYHIKRGGPNPPTNKEEYSPEDRFIRNQIYLAEIDEDGNTQRQSPKKYSGVPSEPPSPIDMIKPKEDSELNLLSHMRQVAEFQAKDEIAVSALISYHKFRENFASVKNRGLISYISSCKQKRGNVSADNASAFKESSSDKTTKDRFL